MRIVHQAATFSYDIRKCSVAHEYSKLWKDFGGQRWDVLSGGSQSISSMTSVDAFFVVLVVGTHALK